MNQALSFMLPLVAVISFFASAFFQFQIAKKWQHRNPWFAFVPILNVVQLFQIAKVPFWHVFIPILGIISSIKVYSNICRLNGERAIFQIYLYVPILQVFALWKLANNNRIFIKDTDQRESVATLEEAIRNNIPKEDIHNRARQAGMNDKELKSLYKLARIGVKNNLSVVGHIKPTYGPEIILGLHILLPILIAVFAASMFSMLIGMIMGSSNTMSLQVPINVESNNSEMINEDQNKEYLGEDLLTTPSEIKTNNDQTIPTALAPLSSRIEGSDDGTYQNPEPIVTEVIELSSRIESAETEPNESSNQSTDYEPENNNQIIQTEPVNLSSRIESSEPVLQVEPEVTSRPKPRPRPRTTTNTTSTQPEPDTTENKSETEAAPISSRIE